MIGGRLGGTAVRGWASSATVALSYTLGRGSMTIERSNEPEAFTAFERDGWSARIGGYERTFARLTSQTAGAMLNAAGVTRGHRVLDVCTGHGVLAAAAAERGAVVAGLDFSEEVVAVARRNVPDVEFRQG